MAPFRKWKGKFPFRVGTTSYIYPGEILPNVDVLSDVLDEVQLLLFEGDSFSNIPDRATTKELKRLSTEKKVAYTIHLPLDAYPGHEDERIRKNAIDMILRIYDVGLQIECERFVFHYASRNPDGQPLRNHDKWRDQLVRSTTELLASGVQAQQFCVENLSYPFSWVEDLVDRFALAKCIDLGHLRVNCHPVRPHLRKHLAGTRVIHLHGLKRGQDHLGLSNRDSKSLCWLFEEMNRVDFKETLILEVFAWIIS